MRQNAKTLVIMLAFVCLPAPAYPLPKEVAHDPDLRSMARTLKGRPGQARLLAIVRAASEGARARALWPELVPLVDGGTPTEQVCAVWALGWLGATEAVPALTRALSSREWRVALDAADVLAGFGPAAKGALDRLEELAKGHWMVAVREHAAAAAAAIGHGVTGAPVPVHHAGGDWAAEREAFVQGAFRTLSGDPCRLEVATSYKVGKQSFDVPRDRDREAVSRALAASLPEAIAKRPELHGLSAVVQLDDGWVVGTDRGPSGGELRFVPKHGASQTLWPARIQTLTKLGAAMLATTSEEELPGLSSSNVILVARTGPAKHPWQAKRLALLPANKHVALPDGEDAVLFVTSYGAVSVRSDGSMREAACPERADEPAVFAHLETGDHQKAMTYAPKSHPGLKAESIRGHVDEALAVIEVVLNHPQVRPYFHLDRSADAVPRVERLPVDLGARAVRVAGRAVQWVAPPAGDAFRFLDLVFETPSSATLAFEDRADHVEGYAIVAKANDGWRVAGLTIVGK